MKRWVAALLLLVACSSNPTAPPPVPRTYIVTGMWVVFLDDEHVCFQLDPYRWPDLDDPSEAIAACKKRLGL